MSDQIEEDYSEFECMEPAANTDELKSLDVLLSNKDMASKLKRYFQSKRQLNGKGDGGAIARDTIRRLIRPEAFCGYSWKGQKRSTREVQLLPFKSTFENVVSFVHSIARAGDATFVEASTFKVFESLLRNKGTEQKRNALRGDGIRTSPRKKKNDNNNDDNNNE